MKPKAKKVYTVSQLCEALELPRSTFFELWRRGELPFLDETLPRLGRTARFRAEPVDRYLAGQWGRRALGKSA